MPSEPKVNVCLARETDLEAVVSMIRSYMDETFALPWMGESGVLERALAVHRVTLAVAQIDEEAIGFVSWSPSYDLHHCIWGAEVLDLFVRPQFRGRAVALRLLAFVADRVREDGGAYMKGSIAGAPGNGRFYSRSAVLDSGVACTLSGRAFRTLADTETLDIRAAVRSLPPPAWNYEA